ncbi:TyeA family type III secretion system gatekeeper subunit [Roseiconus lacunae]|uniref:TyeA family type III secretion system gatekeeper subunit n=1 Tax=Roseiconus lacunae TaxID=2605694 RepID=UPI001E38B34B|nr:TyeA family type III secretion system gatekeeper subunit [Roseiconus lacunae]MCD0457868.1 TyeA family type III secretion system gatekeeper subunit [Roseiconus lacunae]
MHEQDQGQAAQEIIQTVLPLKSKRRIDPAAFVQLAEQLGINEPEQTIYFLREIVAIVRQLPVKAFDNTEERARLIEAIQDALDDAIEGESDEHF